MLGFLHKDNSIAPFGHMSESLKAHPLWPIAHALPTVLAGSSSGFAYLRHGITQGAFPFAIDILKADVDLGVVLKGFEPALGDGKGNQQQPVKVVAAALVVKAKDTFPSLQQLIRRANHQAR